ncbi:hypothetical protein UFOVP115_22 [uncultured Caudovirales phage]|uniref:Uncharacterized protein n=1 Tax=uncultured Caudovirales phage TaxID=2100421 RepID=A0A6J5L4T3_9CAUD|nr:hypothetical protein UFOVP115_22 [uncultured Caudovirales phage]
MDNNTTNDPATIAQLAEEIGKPKVEIKTVAPSNSDVILPGGFIAKDGSLIKFAEVRELNGLDEEAVSKSGTPGKALAAMLQRGVVSIGTSPADKDDLDQLLSGDRDALLIGIRRVTFGDAIDFGITCPYCKTDLELSVDLLNDVPTRTLEDPINDRVFTYMSKKNGPIVVGLPTGSTQKKLIENNDKTGPELNTILLAGCIKSVNGEPAIGAATALKLGMADRDAIINEILKRAPGPRLGEVTTTCEACGEDVATPLSLADLFRL